MEPSKENLKSYFEMMILIRKFEERCAQIYGMGKIGGFCHLYIGQEAVVVGMQAVITSIDSVITSYRDHGHMLACGMDAGGVLAELMGRSAGYSKGKGGSMHMFSKEKKFYGGHGIVGAQIPLGTGLAFAHKYKEDAGVCLAYMGDGAAHQGQVYESFNMAALWKLPVIYIIENNEYAMGTSLARSSATADLSTRGLSYGIPGEQVDGMNILAVIEAGKRAVERARNGQGPTLLEMKTYRYRGHSMSDPAKYRTKEEVEDVKTSKDPIDHIRALLLKHKVSQQEIEDIEDKVKAQVLKAVEFSENSPEPDEAELWTDILVGESA